MLKQSAHSIIKTVLLVVFVGLSLSLYSMWAQTGAVFSITSPHSGQQYNSGDTILLSVSPAPGVALTALGVVGPNIWDDREPPSTIPIPISQGYAGPLTLHVTVVSDKNVQGSAYVTVNVVPLAALQQIKVEPPLVQLVAPGSSAGLSTLEEDQLIVTGLYADGINRDISRLNSTLFSSDNPRVATIDSKGHVAAVAPGITVLRITNGVITGSTTVKVNIFELQGDLDGDGDVDQDDLNIILHALNTSSTGPGDPRDLNGDGKIDALDARILVTLCSRPGCATH